MHEGQPGEAIVGGRLQATGGVLWLSGLVGAVLGALNAKWQWAVELAQVQAGFLDYAPGTLGASVQVHLWSAIHQVVALALRAGLSEFACSLALSILIGILSAQAVALTVYVLSGHLRHAIAACIVVILMRASAYGATYPVELLPTAHTQGVLGLSLAVLIVALAAGGYGRLSAFLAGACVAVHPTIGAWPAGAIGLAILVEDRGRLTARARCYLAGLAVSAASLALHLAVRPSPAPPIPPDEARDFLRGVVQFWDTHRQPVRWSAAAVWFNVAAIGLSSVAWTRVPRQARILLAFVAGAGVAALALAGVAALPFDRLPSWFVASMPSRWLGFGALLLAPLLFALAGLIPGRFARIAPVVLFWALMFSDRSPLQNWGRAGEALAVLPQAWVLLVASVVAFGLLAGDRARAHAAEPATRPGFGTSRAWRWAAVPVLVAATGAIAVPRGRSDPERRERLYGGAGDVEVFRAARRGSGILATAPDLWLVQLRTRRPVLLDCVTFDAVILGTEAAPFVERVLNDVYGLSLFRPPSSGGVGQFSQEAARTAWTRLSAADWRGVRRRYGVTEVMAYPDWPLAIPRIASGESLALHRIPDQP